MTRDATELVTLLDELTELAHDGANGGLTRQGVRSLLLQSVTNWYAEHAERGD